MDPELKENLKQTNTWLRGLFMVLFLIIYGIAEIVWFAIVVFQFLHTLFVRTPRETLLDFTEDLCIYMYEILSYISFGSEERPYPFSAWPGDRAEYIVEDVVEAEEAAEVDETQEAEEGEVTEEEGDVAEEEGDVKG